METHITSCIAILVLLVSLELVHSSLVESSSTLNHGKVSKISPRSIHLYKIPKGDRELSQVFIDAERKAGESNRNKNEPECSPKCVNGECEQLNTCDCKFGWMGESCSESLFCVVFRPINASRLKPRHRQKKIEVFTEDTFMERKRPKCAAECNQSTSIAVGVLRRADMVYYLLPINTTCDAGNASAYTLEQYKYLIAGGTAILLLAIIICTVCLVRKKRKPGVMLDEDSGNDYNYDYVDGNYDYVDVMKTDQGNVYHYVMK